MCSVVEFQRQKNTWIFKLWSALRSTVAQMNRPNAAGELVAFVPGYRRAKKAPQHQPLKNQAWKRQQWKRDQRKEDDSVDELICCP